MTEHRNWLIVYLSSALVDPDTRQSFRTIVLKYLTLATGGRKDSRRPNADTLHPDGSRCNNPANITDHSLDLGGGSEGGNKCSGAGSIFQVESTEVANGPGWGVEKKAAGCLQGVVLSNWGCGEVSLSIL